MPAKLHSVSAEDPALRHTIRRTARLIVTLLGSRSELFTAVPNLSIYRFDGPTKPTSYVLEPSICLVLQGRKQVLLGTEDCSYVVGEFLITSVDLPLVAEIFQASPEKPYVGLALKLDRHEIARVILEENLTNAERTGHRRGIEVGTLTSPLCDAFRRFVDVLNEPENIPSLAPLIHREIIYRLLKSGSGARLRQLATVGDHTHSINRVIGWMKSHLAVNFRIEELAAIVGMSASTLHHRFRTLTTMSPLQYQKRLRLNEARRLMLTSRIDAAIAAFEVGYESPSQFTREYSRLFGNPPRRDIQSLMEMTAGLENAADIISPAARG